MEGMPLAWQLSATPFLYVPTPRVMGLLSRDGELQPWQCPPPPTAIARVPVRPRHALACTNARASKQ